MKRARTGIRGGRCRICGRFLPKGTICYKGKGRKHVCDECYEGLLIHSPDDTIMECDLILPDGRKILVQDFV